MATEYLNYQAAANTSGGTSITISNYVVPAGTNKILQITCFLEDDASIDTTTVTFGGNACTQIDSYSVSGSYENGIATFYYLLGSTTPTGDIVVTHSSSLSEIIGVGAFTLTEVAQQGPESFEHAGSTSASSLSDTITTVSTDAIIISYLAYGSNATLTPTGTGHTLIGRNNYGGGSGTLGFGYVEASSATSYTLGWSSSGTSRFVFATAAWEAAPVASDLNITASTETLTISTTNTTVVVETDTNVTASTNTLTLTPTNATVSIETDTNVTSTPVSLTLTPTNASVIVENDLNITVSTNTLTLTTTNATVSADVDINVTASTNTLTLTTTNATVVVETDTNVTTNPVVLTLTPTNTSITLGTDLNVNAGNVALTLSPTNAVVDIETDTSIISSSVALTLTTTNAIVSLGATEYTSSPPATSITVNLYSPTVVVNREYTSAPNTTSITISTGTPTIVRTYPDVYTANPATAHIEVKVKWRLGERTQSEIVRSIKYGSDYRLIKPRIPMHFRR